MNQFIFTEARLTRDPEVKYLPTQRAMCNLLIAVDRPSKDADGNWTKKTDFPRVTVFGKDAENLDRLSAKGLRVNVRGHLETGSYKKGEDTIYTNNLICERLEIVDFKGDKEEKKDDIVLPDFKEIDGDIPF